jgi:multiple sugar transport system substrate-binding protein
MKPIVKVALTGGGMYDALYERIPQFEQDAGVTVAVEFHGSHMDLNAYLDATQGAPCDLVTTHTKYAPSQRQFLAPLEGFDTSDFFPSLVEMCEIGGALYGIPRNIDLRLLHYRSDMIDSPPATWDELVAMARSVTRAGMHGYVLTGVESGLFGNFFELTESAGAHIFLPSMVAQVNNEGGRWALGVLRELYESGAVPAAIAGWHFEEIHKYFREGHAAMVTDWPGYYGSYRDAGSAVRGRFKLARMPAGPTGRVCCYAGSHTFALTRTGVTKEPAREFLRFLLAPEQQMLEAQQGSVPARRSVMEAYRKSVQGDEAARMGLLENSIEHDLIIPPKLSYYPRIEEILWRNVRSAMIGETAIPAALAEIERRIAECVRENE